MAHTAYLTLRGAKQGLISGGCNTKDSMGNRYQENHTDQITVLACHFSVRKEPHQHGLSRDSVHITKHIDKATPLLATAFARQEFLYDDNFSSEPWKQIADKIINLAFPDKKPIQILLDYRDESKNRVPTKIFEEF
ncbi:type VI secretion system tube protein TssD [Vibrio sp. MEBiC08052]|uniref:type VI secretion system tube protein TssD n=1 Tax=Vibrio sp. MEBiC08052 TaxID=1761910 RepID=UPI000740669A|nr:type VI secretion system tube protein TssD [Vibrio sp. MEBiC08052]KUI97930.1 hypothetical protein VRK_26310 [Vibrio sp. MEBiC08052]